MTTLLLYAATVLIWGTTWIMMKFQLGTVAPAASLTYRYAIAALIVFAIARFAGERLMIARRHHPMLALQGLLMFSVNYWLTYLAAAHLTTGVISVMFSSASALTILFTALAARAWPKGRAVLGAGIGVLGVGCLFYPEIAGAPLGGPVVWAVGLVVCSVTIFALGALVGQYGQGRGLPVFAGVAWAMVYGSLWMALVVVAGGDAFTVEWTWRYLGSLFWLTVLGSAAVFALYFAVVQRIGAEKAAYATVMFPIVALCVSTVFEGYQWTTLALIGVPLALIGNALVLGQRSPPARGGAPGKA